MSNKPGVRHYFAEGLTMRGYVTLVPLMMENWQHTYVFLGGPGTGKSTLIKLVGLELLDRGYEIDFLRSARDPDSIAGLILPEKNLAMLDAIELSPLRWRAPGIIEKFIDFGAYCDERKLQKNRKAIIEAEKRLSNIQSQLEEELAEGLGRRLTVGMGTSQGELLPSGRTYSSRESEGKAGAWLLVEDALAKIQKSRAMPCFLHGLTPEGWLNLAPHFLSDYDQIRLEGEETLDALSWVLREAQHLGQVIEIILHPINPDDVIGLVFTERRLAIWQGNPENLADQGLAQPFSDKLKVALANVQQQRALLRGIYMDTVDFNAVDELREDLLNQVLRELEG